MNALKDEKVAVYLSENYIATYLKVGTFQIVNGQKQGGNVASYFCVPDGSVVHAVAGKVNAHTLLNEARWAVEIRKSALTLSTRLGTGVLDEAKYRKLVAAAHEERFNADNGPAPVRKGVTSLQSQVNWLLAQTPLVPIEEFYPTVWQRVLGEQLSVLPVAQR